MLTPRRLVTAAAILLAGIGLGACSEDEEPEINDDWADPVCEDGKCDGAGAVPRVSAPEVFINDPAVLRELETSGYGLDRAMGGEDKNNSTLMTSSTRFASLVTTLGADIAEFKSRDSEAGVGLAYSHRQFDVAWLRSDKASFRLVGVVNRIDLMHRTPNQCGEVRFIYRLMYTTAQGSSRLPMSINVVHEQPASGGSCAPVARAWRDARGQTGALQTLLAQYQSPQRIEINLQAVRWPAVTRADMGGHAEYLLRIFGVTGGTLSAEPLPNTLRTDLTAAQKTALAAWVTANAAAVDRGDALVPTEFLATRAISVSPRGLARGANRGFLAAFPQPEQTFAAVNYGALSLVKSAGGLVRKLDTMSCQGCHQSRGLAGFHILGDDEATTFRANAIEVGSSPHLNDELPWRKLALDDIASGRTIQKPRPFAERSAATAGGYGAHCGLGGDPSFAPWTCSAGFECKDISGEEIGMCVSAGEPGAGDSCETSDVSFDVDPTKDRVSAFETQQC
ncbi:MAG: hypothetical protein H0T42_05500, partial [Deltaproteobacteria bacterium]|nr:hypothetical protein [Deltaproteobacteria bacterium]